MSEGEGDVFLETDRLILRRFTMDDADLLVALDSDPDVTFHITGGAPTSRDEVVNDYLPAYLEYYRRYPGYGFWAAIEKATGEFIGWFHLRPEPSDPEDEPDLGYRLVKSAWGKGYGTEGSRALIRKGFEELGVRRVHAAAMAVNRASWRVMQKAGMRFERAGRLEWPFRIPGDLYGDVVYAITREQWLADQAAEDSS